MGQVEITAICAKNLSTRKGHLGPDARKFSSAKISTFTVYIYPFSKILIVVLLKHQFHSTVLYLFLRCEVFCLVTQFI